MANIGIDLDEVLADFNTSFIEFHNKKYNSKLNPNNIKDYFLRNLVDISAEEEMKRLIEFCDTGLLKTVSPFPEAIISVKNLLKNNNLYLITARPNFMEEDTLEWVEKYFPNTFKEVIITSHVLDGKIEKSEVCLSNNINYMIEDNSYYANECASFGVISFLLTRSWNINDTLKSGVIRVSSWKDIEDKINENI